ncbi:hypothetical protein FBU59_003341 [Linderina macrospora]|uniref:Uncharacterized protein n=1 Tax=Linderina macrospora TaxID=4868 RepID=A0ACC1J8K4_9FUNG|nr:hypothetical protein FBU59_003341 [Linderina macrospora]
MDVNSHPFHLHGHQFFIITRGSVDNDPSKKGLSLTFIEAPYRINNFTKLPMQLTDNCKLQDIPVSGNALGKVRLDLAEDPRGPFPLSGF